MHLKGLVRNGFGLSQFGRSIRKSILRPAVRRIEAERSETEHRLSAIEHEWSNRLAALDDEFRAFRLAAERELADRLAAEQALAAELAALRETGGRLDARIGSELSQAQAELSEALMPLSEKLRLHEDLIIANAGRGLAQPLVEDRLPKPHVSILLPTYNRAGLVLEAIRSVLAQDWQNWELIIVDDASDDDTERAIAPLLADPRIRYIRRPERGGGQAARLTGFREAKGEFVALLDSDNVYFPGFLDRAVGYFREHPDADVAYGVLVSDMHALKETSLLFRAFDREALLAGNYIDTSTIIARRKRLEEINAFQSSNNRFSDWEMMMQLTETRPAHAMPVLAAKYRRVDDIRISDTVPAGPNYYAIQDRWRPLPAPDRPLRILYVVWHYPQLSETYIETEIRAMRRFGVEVAIWCEVDGASLYPTDLPIHRGTLDEAIQAFAPDILHIHWLNMISALGSLPPDLPVTLRAHGFEANRDTIGRALAHPSIRAVYCFPHQLGLVDGPTDKLRPLQPSFDPELFFPGGDKDKSLVVRTAAALPSKELNLFLELAKRLPQYRFVLAIVTCKNRESYVDEVLQMASDMNSPADIRVDVPREDVAALVRSAGIYFHTIAPPGHPFFNPIGMPISIAEAMATGAVPIVRKDPALTGYVDEAGASYDTIEEAEAILTEMADWTEARWHRARHISIDRAYLHHAAGLVLRPLYADWVRLAGLDA